jgi:hypothetical protein
MNRNDDRDRFGQLRDGTEPAETAAKKVLDVLGGADLINAKPEDLLAVSSDALNELFQLQSDCSLASNAIVFLMAEEMGRSQASKFGGGAFVPRVVFGLIRVLQIIHPASRTLPDLPAPVKDKPDTAGTDD